MHMGFFESIGYLKYYVEYVFNHSFSGPPSSANIVNGS
jgi:hypothetical protein